jgi:protoporphyrinogen/coproporphyrinogen III oxidase
VGVKIAVLGGGISGLCAAHNLVQAGHDVTCFEASNRPGGLVRSERRDGFLCEVGPQAILDGAPEVRALFDQVGLTARVCRPAPAARRRMIYVGGKLRTVPTGPGSLLGTDLLSWKGKWRLMREGRIAERPAVEDESVLEFAARRAGPEAAQRLAAPAVLGVFSGDAAKLSMRSAFPRMAALESRHGSLIRGMKAARREGVTAGQSVSFPEGLEELPRALAEKLGPRLVNLKVSTVKRDLAGWKVEHERFDGVVVALSPQATAQVIEGVAPAAAAGLRALELASVAVVALGFRTREVGMDLDAYGFLVARGERPTILGCQYESTVFPGRAPEGATLLRVIMGGTFEPGAVDRDDQALVAQALDDLRTIAGLDAKPDFTGVWRMRQVLPQYLIGHERRAAAIEAAVAKNLRLHLLTIGVGGVGLSDCIRKAAALAHTIGPA